MITVNVTESNVPATRFGLAASDFVFFGDVDGREISGNTYDVNGNTLLHVVEFDDAGNSSTIHSCNVEVEKSVASIKAAIEAHYDDVIDLCFDFDMTAP